MGYSVQEAINRYGRRSGAGGSGAAGLPARPLQTNFGSTVRVNGLEELKRKLADVPKAMRMRVLRNALAAGAREVRDVAKRNAPVLTLGTSMKAPYRKPGTVRDAIRVRTSKAARRAGDVGVFVNVKPAKALNGGAKSRNDPFYWRWLEFGWTPATGPRKGTAGKAGRKARRALVRSGAKPKIAGRGFLQAGANRLPAALAIFEQRIAKWVNQTDAAGKAIP